MDKIITLIEDLILMETERDAQFKVLAIQAGKASKAVGESAILFHLKTLKELCEAEDKRLSNLIDTTYHPVTLTNGVKLEYNGDAIPITVFSQPTRRGCVGMAFCPKCDTVKSGTCFCMYICPDCRGTMRPETDQEREKYYANYRAR